METEGNSSIFRRGTSGKIIPSAYTNLEIYRNTQNLSSDGKLRPRGKGWLQKETTKKKIHGKERKGEGIVFEK